MGSNYIELQEIGLDGLGRLDDSMMKLLAADADDDVGGGLDQHIADADTEEHLKS